MGPKIFGFKRCWVQIFGPKKHGLKTLDFFLQFLGGGTLFNSDASRKGGSKTFCPKKFWVQNYFEFKKNLGPKNFGSNKNFGSEKILVPKKFGSKKILGSKNVIQKNLGPKNFGSEKILGQRNLDFQKIPSPKKIGSEIFLLLS